MYGVDKYDQFWKQGFPIPNCRDVWTEEEISVSIEISRTEGVWIHLWRRRKVEEGCNELDLRLYTHPDEPSPLPYLLSSGDVPIHSASSYCFDTIRAWINNCAAEHTWCKKNEWQRKLPSRLLELGPGSALRLVFASELKGDTEYVALSHSWGRKADRVKPIPSTTVGNIEDHCRSIDIAELTKTFQDAIQISHRLGLKHIWIDSLCIIQDDKRDWEVSAGQMASIYENAYVVISATRTRTGDDGCFSERIGSHKLTAIKKVGQPVTVYVRREAEHRHFIQTPPVFDPVPLFERAWCFQERLLAQRIIHYTDDEIYWECGQSLLCECGSITDPMYRNNKPDTGNFKLQYTKFVREDDLEMKLHLWYQIIHEYSQRALTFESDLLPALSGTASQIASPILGRYYAGIWEHTMPQALLWRPWGSKLNHVKRRPAEYRAPSWSWAAIDAACMTWNLNSENTSDLHYPCQILEIDHNLISSDPYGQISDASIRMTAPTFTATVRYSWNKDLNRLQYWANYGDMSDRIEEDLPLESDPGSTPDKSEILVAVVMTALYPLPIRVFNAIWGDQKREHRWQGLALRSSIRRPGCYERIGRVEGPLHVLQQSVKTDIVLV